MKDKQDYKVKTQKGYVIWTLTYTIDGNAKVEYDFIKHHDLSDSFDYQDACAIAFDLICLFVVNDIKTFLFYY